MRTLKVQPVYNYVQYRKPRGPKVQIRLMGAWLAEHFPPNSRVAVTFEDGKLILSPIAEAMSDVGQTE